jgi:anti-anti-sigma regulatory factor
LVTEALACPEDVVMQISGDICVVRLQGSLGPSSAPRIVRLAERISSAGCTSVLVDASLLGAVSDGCQKALAYVMRSLRSRGIGNNIYGAAGAAADALAAAAFTR